MDGWAAAYGTISTALPPLITGALILFGLKMCSAPAVRIAKLVAARISVAQTRSAVAGFAPAQVRVALRGEPPHAAAAIISALPAATAAAVLDLYPPEERGAIVRRMSRAHSPLLPDYESVLNDAAIA